MAKDPTQPVATIDILSPEERRLILETWNGTSEVYHDRLCFHQLFELQVDKTSDATATVYENQSICVERSSAMIIGALAIKKAGWAYVPLDPSHADGRIKYILQDASPTIAVADQIGKAILEDSALTIVDPNTLLDTLISNPYIPELTSRHSAYIIYTSGSTGKPKGVMIEHRGVVNLAQTYTTPSSVDGRDLPLPNTPISLVLGGEPMGLTLLQNLITQGYTVINAFGPTKVTVSPATWRCPPFQSVDLSNILEFYLLDRDGQPVPLGAIGEMYVGGIGVAPYVVAKPEDELVHKLRAHLVSRLPDYMIPAAIVRLDNLPLTSNDKIDRRALPEPDSSAFAQQAYEGPQGEIETCLAQLWAELLSLDKVGRHDDFFVIGGHSLLAVRMLNHLRHQNLATSFSTVYRSPVLGVLAHALEKHQSASIPPNLITPQTTKLTPEMLLPLISLSQSEIDHIIEMTPGGVANIQDIYSLSPFQDGVLFHYLLTSEGDPYLISAQTAFETRDLLDRYLQASQEVVNRHDRLRMEGYLHSCTSSVAPSISTHTRTQQLTQPRVRSQSSWISAFTLSTTLIHHLIGDHLAAEIMNHEIEQVLHGQGHSLATPHPFRNAIAQARSKIQHGIHKPFFQDMLGDIDEPTFLYGMVEVQNNGADVTESHSFLSQELNSRLRFQAKQMGVSLASLCHVAWSLVLARTSGQERVVFGTVLFGGAQFCSEGRRMNDQEVGPTMGIIINTLPFRCDINSQSVRECVHLAHIRLAALLEHEHASLALAQKCSGVPAGTPLFSALLNYVHTSLPHGSSEKLDMEFTSEKEQVHYPGIEFLGGRGRTNDPFGINVLDYESGPDVAVARLEIVPPDERKLLTHGFNTTRQSYPADLCIHHLFEQQVDRTPEATALVFNGQSLTFTALNERANKLAHHLISLGVRPDRLVSNIHSP
ncbi:MAG: hypothetical protein J3Q66DRAFT_423393 [Benniella sp.]|nr:MAG: hypothetical protein J3Q66DRAFT_423393 [Benniella sp.]